MAHDPLDHSAAPPRADFVPPHLEPLSMRTAVRFASYLIAGVGFLGGIFLLLTLLLAAGVVIMMVWESMPLGEAVYFVLITALTIGYGDITPQTAVGRVVAPCLGLVGMVFTGMVIALAIRAVDFTVSEEVARQAAAQPTPPTADEQAHSDGP